VGVRLNKWCGDAAVTVAVGEISEETRRVLEAARTALDRAIEAIRGGVRLSAVCGAIQRSVEAEGFSVVRQFTGHGIGRSMHEEPQVPNFVARSMPDPVLQPGVTLALEPMVNAGGHGVEVMRNGWTVVTKDRSLSAHFEHTVAVTDNGAEILTR
jgi:methionyl aminopeptidase